MPGMVDVGSALIVGDKDLEDLYVADLMKVESFSMQVRNPVVKIRFVLRYPIQHAILWTDIPLENKAIDEGVICRLNFIRIASPADTARFGSYAESLKAAQSERLIQARRNSDDKTAEIILRHMRGEYQRQRVLITYKEWEINAVR